MIEIKRFAGLLNSDDREEDILPSQHIDALNGRFYGGTAGLTFENIKGNTLITNSLPAGINECCGSFYDSLKQRLYWFNWNSDDRHGIYYYNINLGTVVPLLISRTDSSGDILGFNLNNPIASINIIYTTEEDGDILTWTARNKRPKALNILEAENNLYGNNWLEKYLDVAKETPSIPPKAAYEDDATVTVNNVRKKIFKFKYRNWYSDNEKSTWSSHSEIPVPYNYIDPQTDTDPTKNSRIGLVVQTGDASVKKIEIAATESLGNVFSNYFSVIILDKDELGITDNDVYIWRFYNNEAYNFVELNESNLLFDYVPDLANAQELLNGNVIVYGGITEGKDPVVPQVAVVVGTEYPLAIDATNILSVTQYGLEGFQMGEPIRFVVLGTIRRGQTFRAAILVGATTFTITYTAVIGDTPATVLVGLSANAVSQGFTQVSISANELVISRSSQILLRHNIGTTDQSLTADFVINFAANTVTIVAGASYLSLFTKGVQFFLYGNTLNVNPFTVVSSVVAATNLVITVESTLANETFIGGTLYFVNPLNNSIPAYNSSSKENFSLFYFDEKGKTNGATTSEQFNVNTQPLGLSLSVNTLLFKTPYIEMYIYHRPPLWAKYYHWGRTANLTKQNSLFWVTDRTYKDEKYAYISIESINAYKKTNSNSIISYDFLPGDRIKFYALYNSDATPEVIYGDEHDYEIYGQVINPDINGVVRNGQFLKIILPTTSSVFDFSNGLTLNYNYYYIELYTPAKSASEGLDVYYEFSERYEIGNAGTVNAYHQGMLFNQTADLISPATFKFNKGDAYYRTRSISVGNVILYDLVPGQLTGSNTINGTTVILGQELKSQTYPTVDYTVASLVDIQPFVYISSPPNYNHPGWTINVNLNTYSFRVKGAINLSMLAGTGSAFSVVIFVFTATSVVNFVLGTMPSAGVGQTVVFDVDTIISMPINSKAYLVITSGDFNFNANLVSGYLSYSEPQKEFNIGVVDDNFSDFYESKVNSNGRPHVVNPDEKTNFFPTLLRWGRAYQQNTNINQINRFFPEDFDEVDRSRGEIQRFKTRDGELRVFLNRAVGRYGIYKRFIQNNEGNPELISTNEILTKNNINYYTGEFGLGHQYTGLVSASRRDYFVDPVRGYQIRLSDDGFTPISEIYKGQFYISSLLVPYNKPFTRVNGYNSKILGCYDYINEEYITVLQEGAYNTKNLIDAFTFSFNERRNGYSSFFSYHPEWITSAEDIIYSWLAGQLYVHNNTTAYCKFYGSQYNASITLVFNINLIEKKTWQSVSELASAVWSCPLIFSNVKSYSGQRQESELIEADFANLEDMFHAAFLRDVNSIGSIINGDSLKGNWLVVKFQKTAASARITLSEVSIRFVDSPLTNK